jgi:hypothetical protein
MGAASSWETERRDDNRKPKLGLVQPNARFCTWPKESVFSGAAVFLWSEQFFSVRGSHRRVRLRSVDEREHILLEHYAYINNSERETAII